MAFGLADRGGGGYSSRPGIFEYFKRNPHLNPGRPPTGLTVMARPKKTKIKTHKGTKKRFRLTATGKVKHRSTGTSHLAQALSNKRRRNLRGTTTLDPCMEPTIHAALNGYSY